MPASEKQQVAPSPSLCTPAELHAYLRNYERPYRAAYYGDAAHQIMRYGAIVGSRISHYRSLPRAMDYARQLIDTWEKGKISPISGTIITADQLTGARGRFTRSWHAPPGGLWGVLVLVNTLLPASRRLLPIAMGITGWETVQLYGVQRATIRWVNDVMIGARKLAGFLAYSFVGANGSGEEYDLLGFGVNVNNREFPHHLQDHATSLGEEVGDAIELSEFACRFFAKLSFNIGLLYSHEHDVQHERADADTSHPLISRLREASGFIGRRVRYGHDVEKAPRYEAVAAGIDNDGGLRLRLNDGVELVEQSGEIRYLDENGG